MTHPLRSSVLRLSLTVFSKEVSEIPVTVSSKDIIKNNHLTIHKYKHICHIQNTVGGFKH